MEAGKQRRIERKFKKWMESNLNREEMKTVVKDMKLEEKCKQWGASRIGTGTNAFPNVC